MESVTDAAKSTKGGPAPAAGWEAALADSVTDPEELCRILQLPAAVAQEAGGACAQFSLRVPRSFLSRIPVGDPGDPLLRQVLPTPEECRLSPGFRTDPLDESAHLSPLSVLAKYEGRSLIVATWECGVHCRFCFRRGVPRVGRSLDLERIEAICQACCEAAPLEELILSGGDPLVLPDPLLAQAIGCFSRLPQLRRFRIHTRMPIVIPQRVTPALRSLLTSTRLAPVVVVHVNHPAELDDSVQRALTNLVDTGITTLSQTVLLRGVNDSSSTLAELFRRLLDLRVLPYYLHQLDPAAGAAHFEVSVERGRQLMDRLRASLPGYGIPRYVQELPGEPSKRWLL